MDRLTPSERAALQPYLTPSEAALLDLWHQPTPRWTPQPGPQTLAYLSSADQLFYGGAAGGGKSDLLLGLALTAHRRSVLFRREYKQLRALVDRSKELVGSDKGWNGQDLVWRRLPDPKGVPRMLEFGAVQFLDDVKGWQGRPHDAKLFDELPNFLEQQYRFLIGWTRTTIPGQRTRIVGAGNPPTSADGEWVVRLWGPWLDGQHPRPAKPGELRWFAMVAGKETEVEHGAPFTHKAERIQPISRTFIPARLGDNPYLLQTGYMATLQAMPEPLRSQMLYGDFSVGVTDDPWQVIPTEWVRAAQRRWTDRPPVGAVLSCVGGDIARGGQDKTVLSRRYGTWFAHLEKHPGKTTPDGGAAAGLILKALADGATGSHKPVGHIDAIGVGASAFDTAKARGGNVKAIVFSEAATGKDRAGVLEFANMRAEAYWQLREALDPEKGDGLALPPDPELLADLCAPKWQMRSSGVLVEAKKDIVKRLGRSPDCGDAAVLAHYQPRQRFAWTAH